MSEARQLLRRNVGWSRVNNVIVVVIVAIGSFLLGTRMPPFGFNRHKSQRLQIYFKVETGNFWINASVVNLLDGEFHHLDHLLAQPENIRDDGIERLSKGYLKLIEQIERESYAP